MTNLTPIKSKVLTSSQITHGFFGRRGGVSGGLFSSLNCGPGSGDSALSIIENRARVAGYFGIASSNLLCLRQVHSPRVVEVRAPWKSEAKPEADAMVTRERGLALSILTADCGPVLFADSEAGVVGAAHAGWKGALTGVLDATVDEMIGLGADRARICASIGPMISGKAYEVGPEFIEHFLNKSSGYEEFFNPSERDGHHYFDLPAFIAARLDDLAIGEVENLDRCTYALEGDFFSYRRATHQKETDYGRNISVITLGGDDL